MCRKCHRRKIDHHKTHLCYWCFMKQAAKQIRAARR